MRIGFVMLALFLINATSVFGQDIKNLQLSKVKGENARYRGKNAVHLVPVPITGNDLGLAVVTGSDFQDGTIEVDVSGGLAPGASDTARGFIGIVFRIQPDMAKFEEIYLRPANGRADDQLRRNHSTQYESYPEWPWDRLRKENPGVYESYVDLQLGVWTSMKIVVEGTKARLYVDGASQPCLVVNDLKLGNSRGTIALYVGPGTDGYFANLKVTPTK
jgi:hypothetical protein